MDALSVLVGGGLAVVGAGVGWTGFRNYALAEASASWPAVTGTIRATRLKRVPRDEDSDKTYQGIVEYEYAIGGHTFVSTSIAVDRDWLDMTELDAVRLADRYPLMSPVQVFYDPANPSRAVLEPGGSGRTFLSMLVGGGLVLGGLLYMF